MKMKLLLLVLISLPLFGRAPVPMSSAEKQMDAKLSPSLRPVKDVPGLPRVLLLGDSISMGYTLRVRALLAGKANVHRAPTNCGPTTKGLAEIDAWIGTGHWDVIHFNFGLHDLKFLKPGVQAVPPARYEANLRQLVAKLEKTGAHLVWASTTPVTDKHKPGQFPRVPADVVIYNAIAAKVVGEHGIAIDDLYAAVADRLVELQNPTDVHFKSRGYDVLAGHVAAAITAALPAPAKP